MARALLLSLAFTALVGTGFFAFELLYPGQITLESPHPGSADMPDGVARSIAAYGAIQASLEAGKLDGVAKNAKEIAEFFDGVNPLISAKAHELSQITEVEMARTTFDDLTVLFRESAQPRSYPENPETFEL